MTHKKHFENIEHMVKAFQTLLMLPLNNKTVQSVHFNKNQPLGQLNYAMFTFYFNPAF